MTKRTKTFTGCLTCRSRGVKCDQEKPSCRRCQKADLCCKGYGIALTWPGCKERKGLQRMLLLSDCHWLARPLSSRALSSAINDLDLIQDGSLTIGPFGVFPASSDPLPSTQIFLGNGNPFLSEPELSVDLAERDPAGGDPGNSLRITGTRILEANTCKTPWDRGPVIPGSASSCLRLPFFTTFPMKLDEERRLMHYWIQFLSPSMIPIESPTNPFQTVISPLALSATHGTSNSASHSALLHAVYALAEASRANLQQVAQTRRIIGARHQQLSLQYLSRSISGNDQHYPEVVLAAITILVLAGIINGDSTDWRIHLRGAFSWINSVEKSVWRRNRNASTIYQIFLGVEALRPAHISLALELEPRELFLYEVANESSEDWSWEESDYCLDSVFCIPRDILETIIRINRWIYIDSEVPAAELGSLETLIIRNNPDAMGVSLLTNVTEKLMWHHKCLWHAATHIYFKRMLQKLPLSSVQYLVQQSAEQLDAITFLELGQNVSGILWPAFISGCEADEISSRNSINLYFDKRETLGIGNVKDARSVVREVWRRRDEANGATDISWHEVMWDLGINISIS